MKNNYMEQVAKILGVELGEPFELTYANTGEMVGGIYAIEENGFWQVDTDNNTCDMTFTFILTGDYIIKKLSWKPQINQVYYLPKISNGFADYDTAVCQVDTVDNQRFYAGMMCKTRKEAVAKAEKMLVALKAEVLHEQS